MQTIDGIDIRRGCRDARHHAGRNRKYCSAQADAAAKPHPSVARRRRTADRGDCAASHSRGQYGCKLASDCRRAYSTVSASISISSRPIRRWPSWPICRGSPSPAHLGWLPIAVAVRFWSSSASPCRCCSAPALSRASVLSVAQGWPLALLAVALLAVPTQTFGQREHIALIAMLPMLAVLAGRVKHSAPSWPAAIAAGIGAAIALSFKPLFRDRPARRAGRGGCLHAIIVARPVEYLALAVALALYAAVVIVLFPEFLTVIGPMVRDVYLQVQQPVMMLLEKPAVALWATTLLAAVVLKRRVGVDGPFVLLLVTSAGCRWFCLQGKGWPYHSYPMIALALLAGYARMTYPRSPDGSSVRRRRGRPAGALFMRSMLWFDVAFDARPLQENRATGTASCHSCYLRRAGHRASSCARGRRHMGFHGSKACGSPPIPAPPCAAGRVSPAHKTDCSRPMPRVKAHDADRGYQERPTLMLVDDLTGSGSGAKRIPTSPIC